MITDQDHEQSDNTCRDTTEKGRQHCFQVANHSAVIFKTDKPLQFSEESSQVQQQQQQQRQHHSTDTVIGTTKPSDRHIHGQCVTHTSSYHPLM